jgi:hypothetical protein
VIVTYYDPGLLWLDDEPEPDPTTPEILTIAGGVVWWTAAPIDTDD